MPILTNSQRSALSRAEAAANDIRPQVEYLEKLAAVDPRIADRVQELRVRLDYLSLVSQTALQLDRTLD